MQRFRQNPAKDPWRNPFEFELTRSKEVDSYHVQAIYK